MVITHAEKLHQELMGDGSVTINNRLEVEKSNLKGYDIKLITSRSPRVVKSYEHMDEQPTVKDIQKYYDISRIFTKWDSSGYGNVGEWKHSTTKYKHKWETPEGNSIFLQVTPYYRIKSSSTFGRCVIYDYTNHRTDKPLAELCMADILYSIGADEFDYRYAKCKSAHENLTEVYGVGKKVATDLIANHNCESYLDVVNALEDIQTSTKMQMVHKSDAIEELQKLVDNDAELIDPEVFDRYSPIALAQNI